MWPFTDDETVTGKGRLPSVYECLNIHPVGTLSCSRNAKWNAPKFIHSERNSKDVP